MNFCARAEKIMARPAAATLSRGRPPDGRPRPSPFGRPLKIVICSVFISIGLRYAGSVPYPTVESGIGTVSDSRIAPYPVTEIHYKAVNGRRPATLFLWPAGRPVGV
jgi:hypothetical protein